MSLPLSAVAVLLLFLFAPPGAVAVSHNASARRASAEAFAATSLQTLPHREYVLAARKHPHQPLVAGPAAVQHVDAAPTQPARHPKLRRHRTFAALGLLLRRQPPPLQRARAPLQLRQWSAPRAVINVPTRLGQPL